MMQRDVRGVLVGLVGAFAGACASGGGEHGDGYRCESQPPTESREEVPMSPALCWVPPPVAPAPSASAEAPVSASARPLEIATDPGAAAGPDPATCELDCNRACPGGQCTRISATAVSCVRMTAGHACGRLIDGASIADAPATEEGRLRAMFELEAISAAAFDKLAGELALVGAPSDLVARARDHASEERHHARLLRERLEARGEVVSEPAVADVPPRSLAAIAEENAVEGCVRETIGAAFALAAAARASTPEDRAFYAAIAADELAHAEWSWALDAWARANLPDGGAALESRRTLALAAVEEELDPAHMPGVSPALASDLQVLARAITTVIRLG